MGTKKPTKESTSNEAMDALLDEAKPSTVEEIATADVNIYKDLTEGQYSELHGRGSYTLPIADQEFIGALFNKAKELKVNKVPIQLKRLESVGVKDTKLKGALIREVEKYCIIRTGVTSTGNKVKLVRKMQPKIRQVKNADGRGYTEYKGLSRGGYSVDVDIWKTGEAEDTGLDIVKF